MIELLAIDVGNSNVKYGLFKDGILTESWQHPSQEAAGKVSEALSKSNATIILSSVVPAVSQIIKEKAAGRTIIELTAASQAILTGMDNSMGSDRVADAVAAWKLYGESKKSVVVMGFGTASTLLAINKDGHVVGGWIAPGLSSTLEALHERCALLPLLKMEEQSLALGVDTDTHMRNGVFVGHIGLAKEWLAVARKQIGNDAVAIATGGWSQSIQNQEKIFDFVDASLTLKGIYQIGAACLAKA